MDDVFKTKTMARIFTRQGQLKKAAEIYLFLLKKNPDQNDIRNHLIDIRRRLYQADPGTARDLRPLYEKWISLTLGHYTEKNKTG